jgi:glycine/D-amino acid oxidase-like deaminating enzyme/nitrite reductase/ring-hydroxylating ferredoxin subunit
MTGDQQADVCVIGAGIAGLTTACFLGRAGRSVIVLDAGSFGVGETGHTTAHLANAIDDRYYEIESIHGADGARLAAESHTAAIERIDTIVREERIDCDFERLDGYLIQPPESTRELLDKELAAAQRAGLMDVELVPRAPLFSFDTGPCLRFPRQGQIHPLKYLAGLARAVQRDGGRIFMHTKAEEIAGGKPARVKTAKGQVTAPAIVVATNTPVNNVVAIHTKQAAYQTYAIGAALPTGAIGKALYWDTLDPYHYVRLQPGAGSSNSGKPCDLLIVGGEDHKTGQAHDQWKRFDRLAHWAGDRFPAMEEILFRWSGEIMETVDGLAFIGRNPGDGDNVYIATGDSGMGMTHGTIAGMLLSDLILGRENPWARLYDPARKPVRAAWTFASENLNVAGQYLDWLKGSEVSSTAAVAPGHGAVRRRGVSKIAIYRDERGVLHESSAVCPHLGCIVTWNDAEKSWDCPCHGSRFTAEGQVRHGPALSDLSPAKE